MVLCVIMVSVFMAANLILLFIAWKCPYTINQKWSRNPLLVQELEKERSQFKHFSKSWPIRIIQLLLSILYFVFDYPQNILRLIFKKKSSCFLIINDSLIMIYLGFSIFLFLVPISLSECIPLVLVFPLWRILNILLIKIKLIMALAFSDDQNIASMPRMIILSAINFIELNFLFGLLYSHAGISTDKGALLFLQVFGMFLTWGDITQKLITSCPYQQAVLIFQGMAMLIFIIMFLANIFNLMRKK